MKQQSLDSSLGDTAHHLADSVEQPLAETLDQDDRFGENFQTNMEIKHRELLESNLSSIDFVHKKHIVNEDDEEEKEPGHTNPILLQQPREKSQSGSSKRQKFPQLDFNPEVVSSHESISQLSQTVQRQVEADAEEEKKSKESVIEEIYYTQEEKNKLRSIIGIFTKTISQQEKEVKQQEMWQQKAKQLLEVEKTLDGAAFYFKELDRKFVIYDENSLGIFKADGWFRRKVVWLICWPWFDNFIIIMIAINSLLLAATDYSDRGNLTPRNQAIEASGFIFTITFILEAIIKIMAMGFFVHKNSYLRDPWNWLDFLVVCIGIIEFIPSLPAANLKALRTFRVLRPLRSINAFPSMRRLIGSLLASLPSLGNAVIFMFFIFLLFGILGVNQFQGLLYQRCRYTPEPNKDPVTGKYTDWPIVEDIDRLCGFNGQGLYQCPDEYYCGSPIQFSLDLENEKISDQILINYGITTFDNIFRALITIFQMITLEGWTNLMYNLSDTSQPWMAISFCVLLVFIGSFFLLNVILAVIMDAFDQVDKNSSAKDEKKKLEIKELKKQYGINDSNDEQSVEEEIIEEAPIRRQSSNIIKKQVSKQLKIKMDVSTPRKIGSGQINSHNKDNSIKENTPINSSIKQIPIRRISTFAAFAQKERSPGSTRNVINLAPLKSSLKRKALIQIPDRAQSFKLYKLCFIICTHNTFSFGITFCIIINTALLAMDRHPIEQHTLTRLEMLNSSLSWVFFAEMVIKMLGLGIKEYAQDDFNLFDCAVVLTSIVDLIIGMIGVDFGGGGAISALRAVRLLRVFKLARSWTSFRELLAKMIITLKDIRNFSVLMLLFMFIYTLLGMELYAYKVIYNNEDKDEVVSKPPGEYPRGNFNTFLSGFTTIFIVFIGEDWNSSMYDHVRATGKGSIFFFISLFILGNLVLLNLFLAILLKNFEEPPGKDDEEEGEVKVSIFKKIKTLLCYCCYKRAQQVVQTEEQQKPKRRSSITKAKSTDVKIVNMKEENEVENCNNSAQLRVSEPNIFKQTIVFQDAVIQEKPRRPSIKKSETRTIETFTIASLKLMEVEKSRQPIGRQIELSGNSVYLFNDKNKIRKLSSKIVGHPYFDSLILFLIGFSTILLTLESPLDDPFGSRGKILAQIDVVVSTIFTIELLLKVIVYGFVINGADSYLLNPWNVMDFIIVVFSLISIVFSEGVDLGVIKVLRMLRVLRPLRMISRNPGLRIAVQSLINAIPDIGNVLVVSLLFLLLFAIMGTNFYKGAFYTCHTNNIPSHFIPKIRDKFDCLDFGGEWINADQNFDNVMNSVVTLFNVMTTEGWIEVMWNAVDAYQIDQVPIKNKNQYSVFFFILFMIVGSLFILNMFVGIVINVFNKEKEELQLNHLLTDTQMDWCDVLIGIYSQQPDIMFSSTGNQLIDFCHQVATNKIFDTSIFICIVLNTICLALTWYDEPDGLAPVLETINLVFNIIYTIEALIKFTAFQKDYFNDGWNIFDLVIVLAAWIGMIINSVEGLDIGSSTTVLRSFRISRVFKIIRKYKNLRILFQTFIGAIPQLTNVGGLLFLFLFLYSVLGVFMFAEVKLQDSLNIHANFQSFGGALLTLFRMSTGESWHMLMYDCARSRQITFDCKERQTYLEQQKDGVQGCGSPIAAYIFFISFMVVVSFIFLNLFIAIILESFNTTQDEESLQVTPHTLLRFNKLWLYFDPKGKGFIHVSKFPKLLYMIIIEEIKEIHEIRESLFSGDLSQEEIQNLIFMFNLNQDKILLNATNIVQDEFFKEMDQEQDEDFVAETLKEQKIQEILQDTYEPLVILNEQEQINREFEIWGLSAEDKAKFNHKKILYKEFNKFISTLRLPCYDSIKYYYYYDILEALSRNLFQQLIEKARDELLQQENNQKSNTSVQADQNIGSSLNGKSLSESLNDNDNYDDIDHQIKQGMYKLPQNEVMMEQQNDIKEAKFDQILLRLEQKGQKNNIFKYKEMSKLRAKRSTRVQDKLEQFGPEKSIIDSSQINAAHVILKHYRRMQIRAKEEKIPTPMSSHRTAQGPFSPHNLEEPVLYNLNRTLTQYSGPGNKQGEEVLEESKHDISSRLISQFSFNN